MVVRGGVEPPTFRFSGGFAGPGWSSAGRLTGANAAVCLLAVQDQLQVSRAVVSEVLADHFRVKAVTACQPTRPEGNPRNQAPSAERGVRMIASPGFGPLPGSTRSR